MQRKERFASVCSYFSTSVSLWWECVNLHVQCVEKIGAIKGEKSENNSPRGDGWTGDITLFRWPVRTAEIAVVVVKVVCEKGCVIVIQMNDLCAVARSVLLLANQKKNICWMQIHATLGAFFEAVLYMCTCERGCVFGRFSASFKSSS